MQDYLELVDYIMKESNSSCNGIWLKGSSQHIENGMKLLHQYNYNYSLAKFHILYPTVMNIPNHKEEVMNSLSEKELESIVNDAIIDLKGCKNQEAEEAIANIRNVVSSRVTVEDLVYY